jgi:hypothetical protein
MTLISNEELKDIYGGGFFACLVILVAALVTFAIGVIDGYVRPLKCNK